MFFNELTYAIKVPEDFLAMKEGVHSVRLSYGCKVFERDNTVPLNDGREFLGFYFNLSNNISYNFNNQFSGILHRDQYIFIYLPGTHSEFGVRKGKYSAIGFHFTPQLLRSLTDNFPFLEDFLTKVELRQPCVLTSTPLQATEEMLQAIKGILLYNRRWETDRNIHFFSKVFDILTLCLEQISIINNPSFRSHHYEMPKVRQTKAYLLDHLQEHLTLSLLADNVGMEKHTLARAFKKAYGKTIMDFLTEERMNRAKDLLRDSQMTLQRIAQKVGYKNHTHFTKAFKRKLNVTPSMFRHNNAFNGNKASSQ
jgi:AraC-like DNA-binding protein